MVRKTNDTEARAMQGAQARSAIKRLSRKQFVTYQRNLLTDDQHGYYRFLTECILDIEAGITQRSAA